MNENPFVHHPVTPITITTTPRDSLRPSKELITSIRDEAKRDPDAVWYVYIGAHRYYSTRWNILPIIQDFGQDHTVAYQPDKDNPPIKSMRGRYGTGIMKSDKRTDPYELFRNARPEEITWFDHSNPSDSDIYLEVNDAIYYRDYGKLARILVTLADTTTPEDFGRTLLKHHISWTRTIDTLTRVGGFPDHVTALKEDDLYYFWVKEHDEKHDNTDMVTNVSPS